MLPTSSALSHAGRRGLEHERPAAAHGLTPIQWVDCGSLHRANAARSICCGVEEGEVLKCRSNQKDGIWTRAHHRGIQKPRRFPSSYTSGIRRACYASVAMDALENAAQSSDLSELPRS